MSQSNDGAIDNAKKVTILDAAARRWAECGYARVTLRSIAGEAGVALSQLHYYFGSKDDLLLAVVQYALAKRRELLEAELAGVNGAEAYVRGAMALIQRRLLEAPDEMRLYHDLLSVGLHDPAVAARVRGLQAEQIAWVEADLQMLPAFSGPGRADARAGLARLIIAALDGISLHGLIGCEPELTGGAFEALVACVVARIDG